MTLILLIHRPEADTAVEHDMRAAVRDAIWEVADAHWEVGPDVVLAATDLSPSYLVQHFQRAAARRGYPDPGSLMVVPITPKTAWIGLPPAAEHWVREVLD